MATYHCSIKAGNKGSGAAGLAKSDYICREGKYRDKPDLEHKQSGNMPDWAQDEPRTFWQSADQHERTNGRIYTEIEVALPREISPAQRRELVENFIREQLPDHPYTAAIHNPKASLDGGEQPHAHIIFSERKQDGIERGREQFFKRAAAPYRDRKTKELVTPDPASGGAKKDLSWHKAEKILEVRQTWEEHYNRHSPEQVSCRSLKAQGLDREPERHLGPKMARPDSLEAERVIENRNDVKKLEEIEREMAALSREIEEARLEFKQRNVETSELLKEARDYSAALEKRETLITKELDEVGRRKAALIHPYRDEAITKHITQEYAPKWERLNEKITDAASRIEAHNKTKWWAKIGWDLGDSYDKASARLTEERDGLNRQTKELMEDEENYRQALLNPEDLSLRRDKYEVDQLADTLARERDPDYRKEKTTLDQVEEKIRAERDAIHSERVRNQNLCRNLGRVDDRNHCVKLSLPCDRTGKRLTLGQALTNQDTRARTVATMDKLNKTLEQHHKTKERSRGMER